MTVSTPQQAIRERRAAVLRHYGQDAASLPASSSPPRSLILTMIPAVVVFCSTAVFLLLLHHQPKFPRASVKSSMQAVSPAAVQIPLAATAEPIVHPTVQAELELHHSKQYMSAAGLEFRLVRIGNRRTTCDLLVRKGRTRPLRVRARLGHETELPGRFSPVKVRIDSIAKNKVEGTILGSR